MGERLNGIQEVRGSIPLGSMPRFVRLVQGTLRGVAGPPAVKATGIMRE